MEEIKSTLLPINNKPVKIHETVGRRIFVVINVVILIILALSCIVPVIHMLALSLSSKVDIDNVGLIPIGLNFDAYVALLKGKVFITAFFNSVKRVILGVLINTVLTVLMAYPMSKENKQFRGRSVYMILIVITMVFSGGLVPMLLLMKSLNLYDTIWALVLPTAVPTYNVILVMNFMRSQPKEIEEAARIDGAGYAQTLVRIVLPILKPAIATVVLFSFVSHWNNWFDGLVFNMKIENYPLQTYLQVILTAKSPSGLDEAWLESMAGDRSLKAAQIFVTMLPLLLIYPFLQKYFVKGLVLGSVKG